MFLTIVAAFAALGVIVWFTLRQTRRSFPRPAPGPTEPTSRPDTPKVSRDATRESVSDGMTSRSEGAQTLDENVQFTVYRPAEIEPLRWYSLLAFVHLAERRSDEPDAPDPIAEVQEQAERLLDQDIAAYDSVVSDSVRAIPRSGELTLEPNVEGIEFNPPRYTFRWEQSVHRAEFQLRCRPGPAPRTARGRLTIFWGPIIVGDVPLAIRVLEHAGKRVTRAPADVGRPYRNVFASYSHRDAAVVEIFDELLGSLGDRLVQDVRDLRAGQVWSDEVYRFIDRADLFQLFWSWNALASPFVRKEWEFALSLQRENFVRPVYWEDPLPSRGDLPPASLRRLHFHRLDLPTTGSVPLPSPPATASIPASPPPPSPGAASGAGWKFNLTAAAAASLLVIGSVSTWRMIQMQPADRGSPRFGAPGDPPPAVATADPPPAVATDDPPPTVATAAPKPAGAGGKGPPTVLRGAPPPAIAAGPSPSVGPTARASKPVGAPTRATPADAPSRVAHVTIPRAVVADGRSLAPGTYELHFAQASGAMTERGELWVEFRRNGKVVGREVARPAEAAGPRRWEQAKPAFPGPNEQASVRRPGSKVLRCRCRSTSAQGVTSSTFGPSNPGGCLSRGALLVHVSSMCSTNTTRRSFFVGTGS